MSARIVDWLRGSVWPSQVPLYQAWDPQVALVKLVDTLCSAPELRIYVRELPDWREIVNALPEDAPKDRLVDEIVSACLRRGTVADLLQILAVRRPRRYAEISEVARSCGVRLKPRLARSCAR